MSRWLAMLVAVAAAVLSFAFWQYGHVGWHWVVMAWLYTAVGLFAWQRRPENRTGKLMVLTAVTFYVPLTEFSRVPLLWTIGSALEPAWLPMLAYLVLSFPNGRLARRWDRAFVVVASVWVVLFSVIGSMFFDPRADGCIDCQPGLNLILIHSPPWPLEMLRRLLAIPPVFLTRILLMAALILLVASRWWAASRPMRRVLTPVLLPAVALLLAVTVQQVAAYFPGLGSIYSSQPDFAKFIRDVAVVAAIALPVSFLLGLARAWARRTRVGELVVELGELPPLDRLEEALSRALGDPSVSVGRWDAGTQRYVTAEGTALEIPEESARRVATFLEREGTPLAAVVHDPALLEDRGLLDSVSAAARLAVDNERLQAEIRAQLEEVRASRSRIVAATDAERRRLERDLHDGAQQRLVSLGMDARMVEAKLGREADPSVAGAVAGIAEGLAAALRELRELARGIHPAVLSEEGLGPALQSLAERSPLPARVLTAPQRRFDPAVEASAYFVVSEALTNAAKHARASQVTIAVNQLDSRLVVEVVDDGVGGADPAKGSGLAGLADRVAAIDGRLEVKSLPGDGTRVTAEIPCASS
ncbi:MAG: histidine kinase [Actinomycetota bacterium]|nr:histidine kinase [Actinomycetota bacterium]